MSYTEYQHHQPVIFDLANEPVIAHAVFPEFPQPRAVQGFSDAARIVQLRYPSVEKTNTAPISACCLEEKANCR